MAEQHKVRISVVSQKGNCAQGHRIGDSWVVGYTTPEGICTWAFNSLLPLLMGLMQGGSFPWENDPNEATVACPDSENPVVFKLNRLHV